MPEQAILLRLSKDYVLDAEVSADDNKSNHSHGHSHFHDSDEGEHIVQLKKNLFKSIISQLALDDSTKDQILHQVYPHEEHHSHKEAKKSHSIGHKDKESA